MDRLRSINAALLNVILSDSVWRWIHWRNVLHEERTSAEHSRLGTYTQYMGCTCSRAHWNNVADVIPLLLSLFPSLPFISLPFYPFLPLPTPNFTLFTFLPFIPHPLYDLKISRRDENAHPPFSMQPRGLAKVYLESQKDLEFLAEDDQLLGEMKLHCIIFELFLTLVTGHFMRFSFIFYFSDKIALAPHNSN